MAESRNSHTCVSLPSRARKLDKKLKYGSTNSDDPVCPAQIDFHWLCRGEKISSGRGLREVEDNEPWLPGTTPATLICSPRAPT